MKLFNKICVPAALTLAMAAAVSCSDNDDENAGWTELIKVATYNIQYDDERLRLRHLRCAGAIQVPDR